MDPVRRSVDAVRDNRGHPTRASLRWRRAQQLSLRMAEALGRRVICGEVVNRVRCSRDGVLVASEHASVSARQAIITVPPGWTRTLRSPAAGNPRSLDPTRSNALEPLKYIAVINDDFGLTKAYLARRSVTMAPCGSARTTHRRRERPVYWSDSLRSRKPNALLRSRRPIDAMRFSPPWCAISAPVPACR